MCVDVHSTRKDNNREKAKEYSRSISVLSVVQFGDSPSFTQAVFHKYLPPLYGKWSYYSMIVSSEKCRGR